MAKYFVDPDEEITVEFIYNSTEDDFQVFSSEGDIPVGYERHWVKFRFPNWEDTSILWTESSRPTEEGQTVIDPLVLTINRPRRLIKSWSFDAPISDWFKLDPKSRREFHQN